MASQLNLQQPQQHHPPHQATSSSGELTPCEGKPVVVERQDSENDMRALFDTLVMPSSRQRPMRERQLPSSFFSPSTAAGSSAVPAANNTGHHSREGSTDSSYSSQSSTMHSPAHHFRSVSEPVVPSRMLDDPLPPGWQMAVTPQGQRYFLNHLTKSTTWHDPRKSKQYAPVTQQQRTALSRAPFFPQAGGGAGAVTTSSGGGMGHPPGVGDGLQLDASASFMQQFGGPVVGIGGGASEPYRQRSTSWIDPRATGGVRNTHAQRHMHLAKHRMMQQQQQQQQQELFRQQRELMHISGMTTDELMASGLIPGQAVPPVQASAAAHRDALQRDPFMPVTGSVSPDIALQLSASSPASSALSHVREGSTDSGFGLGGVETGLGHVGLDPGNQYDPMVGNAGLFSSFNSHSMSPIPSMGSPRPASAASGSSSFMRQGGGQQHDLAAMAGLEAGLVGAAGIPMDTDDLSAVLNDSDLLNLDNDPMLLQTLL